MARGQNIKQEGKLNNIDAHIFNKNAGGLSQMKSQLNSVAIYFSHSYSIALFVFVNFSIHLRFNCLLTLKLSSKAKIFAEKFGVFDYLLYICTQIYITVSI